MHERGDAITETDRRAASLADAPHESEELLRAWFDRVVREFTSKRIATRHDAEDATMKAIGEMLRAVEPGNRSLAYVRKAALNNVRKEQVRHGKRTSIRLDDPACDRRTEGVTDDRLSEWEGERWCDDVLSRLSPRQREVMECVTAGLDNREIARKLGVSTDVVRRAKSDACKEMRKFIRPDGEYRQPAAPALVLGRNVSRAADNAVAAATSLAAPHRDLRAMSPTEREDIAARVNELEQLLQQCPTRAFGPQDSAEVLTGVAAVATALISDRDELAALKLIRTAHRHLALAGCHQAAYDLQRARAEALGELGHPRGAVSLLRGLSEAERQVFGADNPRTAMHLLWAQAMSGQVHAAEAGYRDLEASLVRSRDPAAPMLLWHVQCRHFWLRGACGQVGESAGGYDRVILNRSRKLGLDNSDALDGGHSKGKMLVVNGAGAAAITILRAVADDRARVQGDCHSDTLETLKYLHLARVQAEPRDDRVLDSTIVDLEQILCTQVLRHGQDHPMSRDTATHLSWLRRRRDAIRFGEPVPSPSAVPRGTLTRLTRRQ
jgi:RNA polymerase sigma factor (sigma-70 family)